MEESPTAIADLPAQPAKNKGGYRIVAVWMKTDDVTPGDSFESQIAFVTPEGKDFLSGSVDTFRFGAEVTYHRIVAVNVQIPGFPSLGNYVVQARLRRAGQTDWEYRQEFPFRVKQRTAEPSSVTPQTMPAQV